MCAGGIFMTRFGRFTHIDFSALFTRSFPSFIALTAIFVRSSFETRRVFVAWFFSACVDLFTRFEAVSFEAGFAGAAVGTRTGRCTDSAFSARSAF